MKQTIKDVMSARTYTVDATQSVEEAAKVMRERDVGDVLVMRDDTLCGIVTDRDIVVRCLAEGKAASTTNVGDICSADVLTIEPDQSIERAIEIMRDRAIRRLPVCENGKPVGMLSLGDLAIERDPSSALADISAAPPNS